MQITKAIKYVGVNDHAIDLFEGQYIVPNGMAYNSYVILDEKVAVLDTVDVHFGQEWLTKIEAVLGKKEPDYLIVQHMEPDHSAVIADFMEKYKNTMIVASANAFMMIKQFFGTDFANRRMIVKEGDMLSLGVHNLQFISAPMVHWPEVIMTYDTYDKVLFSADGFGKFGALDAEEDWEAEAARYYFGIVGKYGVQVQNVLKKAAGLEINCICPLHGPVLKENLEHYIHLYHTWSSYEAEKQGVVIAYTSVYGNTKYAVEVLAEQLRSQHGLEVVLFDLTRCDMAEAVAAAFRYDKLILATTTYNSGIFPHMRSFIEHLVERNYQKRTIALIENGCWAPIAANIMKGMFAKSKDITIKENVVTIRSALSEESKKQIEMLVKEF